MIRTNTHPPHARRGARTQGPRARMRASGQRRALRGRVLPHAPRAARARAPPSATGPAVPLCFHPWNLVFRCPDASPNALQPPCALAARRQQAGRHRTETPPIGPGPTHLPRHPPFSWRCNRERSLFGAALSPSPCSPRPALVGTPPQPASGARLRGPAGWPPHLAQPRRRPSAFLLLAAVHLINASSIPVSAPCSW
jgi:hypothetical protein